MKPSRDSSYGRKPRFEYEQLDGPAELSGAVSVSKRRLAS